MASATTLARDPERLSTLEMLNRISPRLRQVSKSIDWESSLNRTRYLVDERYKAVRARRGAEPTAFGRRRDNYVLAAAVHHVGDWQQGYPNFPGEEMAPWLGADTSLGEWLGDKSLEGWSRIRKLDRTLKSVSDARLAAHKWSASANAFHAARAVRAKARRSAWHDDFCEVDSQGMSLGEILAECKRRQDERDLQSEQPDAPPAEEAPKPIGLPVLVLVDPRMFSNIKVPARRWLIKGWMPWGQVTVLYGPGGDGKTLLAQHLMSSVATGLPWLGMSVERVPALGLFCEDDDDELHRRQADINRHLGIDFDNLRDLRWISRVGEDNAIMRFKSGGGAGTPQAILSQLRAAALAVQARFLVIDGASHTFAGNEIIRGQVTEYISSLRTLAQEIDGCVLLLAHPSAAGMASGRGDGGSTGWSNAVRSRWYLSRPKTATGAPADPDARVLQNMKSNYSALADDINMVWRDGVFVLPEQIASRQGALAAVNKSNRCESAFIEALVRLGHQGIAVSAKRGGSAYAPKVLAKLPALAGWGRVDLEKAMFSALDRGAIMQVPHGRPSRGFMKLVVAGAGDAAPDYAEAA